MKRGWLAIIAVAAAVSAAAAAGVTMGAGAQDVRDAGAVRPAATWGTPVKVRGLAALRKGGTDQVLSVSCASAGNCAASGSWADADSHDVGAFVAAEKDGVWGRAVDVPVGDGEIDSVSCTSAGNCLAGGGASASYTSNDHGFLAEERNGVWGTATRVPGLADLGLGSETGVSTVSCASAGNCAAAGSYQGRHGVQAFVTVERNGRWGTATAVPGLAALNMDGGQTQVLSVSCVPASRCWASGFYYDRYRHAHGFSASEDNGVWSKAIKLPGLPALITGRATQIDAIYCPAPRTCAAGGAYSDRSGHHQAFVTQGS